MKNFKVKMNKSNKGKQILASLMMTAMIAGGCSDKSATRYDVPSLNYEHMSAFNMDLKDVRIVQNPENRQISEKLNPVLAAKAPSENFVNWVNDRVRLNGQDNNSMFVVEVLEEKVTERKPTVAEKGTVQKWFTRNTDLDESYLAEMKIRLVAVNPKLNFNKSYTFETSQSVNFPAKASQNEREFLWFQMQEKMMAKVNTDLEKVIPQVFREVLVKG